MFWTSMGINAGASAIDYAFRGGTNKKNREFNAQQAQKNRDFQERMSSTAYQRTANDMKKAGLNPAMMYGSSGGSPAGAPSGASAQSGSSTGASSTKIDAIGIKNQIEQNKILKANARAAESDAALKASDTALKTAINRELQSKTKVLAEKEVLGGSVPGNIVGSAKGAEGIIKETFSDTGNLMKKDWKKVKNKAKSFWNATKKHFKK